MATVEQLERAVENTEGRTPREVIEAFLPKGRKIGEHDLVEVKYGHCLFLESFKHPLLQGKTGEWTAQDLGIALFTFTRSSEELFRLVKNDQVEEELYRFLEDIPASKHKEYASEIIFHYYRSMNTAVAMESKSEKAQKKTLLGGFFQGLRRLAGNITGLRNT